MTQSHCESSHPVYVMNADQRQTAADLWTVYLPVYPVQLLYNELSIILCG